MSELSGGASSWSEAEELEARIDLDVLRGWAERHEPQLRAPHALPTLARLVPEDLRLPNPRPALVLHGPQVNLGRFNVQHGPTDVIPWMLEDHELFELGAPHVCFRLEEDGWTIEALNPNARTLINGQRVSASRVRLYEGTQLTLGCVTFRFEPHKITRAQWLDARGRWLSQLEQPALLLKRHGEVCGARFELTGAHVVLGRTGPPSLLGGEPLDWDLSGLFEHERRYIAYRHAALRRIQGRWEVMPLNVRMRVFVNRQAISGPYPLEAGDEVGLGSIAFELHEPGRARAESRELPTPRIVDWSEGDRRARLAEEASP